MIANNAWQVFAPEKLDPRQARAKKTASKYRSQAHYAWHVDSLIRPPELQAFLSAQRDKATYDKTAFEACLLRAIPALRLQPGFARPGVAIASGRQFMAP